MWRRTPGLIAALLALAAPARADDRPTFHADIGVGGVRSPGWTPIRVWITGGDRAIDGSVILEHDQDSTQRTRIVAPFATTPGQTVAVDLASFLPDSLMSLRLSLISAHGVPLGSVRYSTYASDGEVPLPNETASSTFWVWAVGSHSLGSTFADRSIASDRYVSAPDVTPPGEPDTSSWLSFNTNDNWSVSSVIVGDLPTHRIAYTQANAIVVSGESASKADPRAIAATLGWVEQGGRLVIVADDMTPHWRAWLPPGPAGDLVVLDDLRATAPPESLRALYGPGHVLPILDAPAGSEAPDEPTATSIDVDLPLVAESFPARVISLTERARRDAWRLRWTFDNSRGLLAEGPLGHGWVTIVGVDPRSTSSLLSRSAQLRVWPGVLGNAVGDAVAAIENDEAFSRQATDATAIEFVASGGPPERGAFIAIIGLMIALALALGPLDFFGLRALALRHRSWVTALGWIAAGSALAYVGPGLVRVSNSRFARLEFVDRVVDPDAPAGAPGRAAILGYSGHYAGTVERVALAHDHPDSWWHGISAGYFNGHTRGSGPVLTIAQAPGGLDGPAPSGRLDSFNAGVWTFRTFADDTAGGSPCTGRAWRDGHGAWHVSLAGLAPEARIDHVVLRDRDGWYSMRPDDGGFVQSDAPASSVDWDVDLSRRNSSEPMDTNPRPLLNTLDPLTRRERALEARLESGRWGVIEAVVRDSSPSPRAEGVADQARILVLRLQVPIQPPIETPIEPIAGANGVAPPATDRAKDQAP